MSDLEGEPDVLVEVPAGEDSAKDRNYTDSEKLTVLRQWNMRKQHHKWLQGRVGVSEVKNIVTNTRKSCFAISATQSGTLS